MLFLAGSATFVHHVLCMLSWGQKQRQLHDQQSTGPKAFLLQKQPPWHADHGNIYIKFTFHICRHFWAKFCPVSNRVANNKAKTGLLKSHMNCERNLSFLPIGLLQKSMKPFLLPLLHIQQGQQVVISTAYFGLAKVS